MRSTSILAFRRILATERLSATKRSFATLPDSVKRVNQADVIPNEYPGQNYAFNWQLNADGVTPIKKASFRITKPLDLKIAGLEQPATRPLMIKAAPTTSMPEAGVSDALTFDKFDEMSQSIRDVLSLSNKLYCPEGHVPNTRIGVRIITNSSTLAPDLNAYLERAPVSATKPTSQPITVYAFEDTETEDSGTTLHGEVFYGYAVEEVEDFHWDEETGDRIDNGMKSVASVLTCGKTLNINNIVTALELCSVALEADAKERQQSSEQASA